MNNLNILNKKIIPLLTLLILYGCGKGGNEKNIGQTDLIDILKEYSLQSNLNNKEQLNKRFMNSLGECAGISTIWLYKKKASEVNQEYKISVKIDDNKEEKIPKIKPVDEIFDIDKVLKAEELLENWDRTSKFTEIEKNYIDYYISLLTYYQDKQGGHNPIFEFNERVIYPSEKEFKEMEELYKNKLGLQTPLSNNNIPQKSFEQFDFICNEEILEHKIQKFNNIGSMYFLNATKIIGKNGHAMAYYINKDKSISFFDSNEDAFNELKTVKNINEIITMYFNGSNPANLVDMGFIYQNVLRNVKLMEYKTNANEEEIRNRYKKRMNYNEDDLRKLENIMIENDMEQGTIETNSIKEMIVDALISYEKLEKFFRICDNNKLKNIILNHILEKNKKVDVIKHLSSSIKYKLANIIIDKIRSKNKVYIENNEFYPRVHAPKSTVNDANNYATILNLHQALELLKLLPYYPKNLIKNCIKKNDSSDINDDQLLKSLLDKNIKEYLRYNQIKEIKYLIIDLYNHHGLIPDHSIISNCDNQKIWDFILKRRNINNCNNYLIDWFVKYQDKKFYQKLKKCNADLSGFLKNNIIRISKDLRLYEALFIYYSYTFKTDIEFLEELIKNSQYNEKNLYVGEKEIIQKLIDDIYNDIKHYKIWKYLNVLPQEIFVKLIKEKTGLTPKSLK